jgi:hypothetical protein
MEVLRGFAPELLHRALADWHWVPGLAGKIPMVTSAFGDVFLEDQDGVWFLDTIEGVLTREWDSPQALQAQLSTPEGQDRFLLTGLAGAAFERGLVPSDAQILCFKIPPILGGTFEPENLEVTDLVVALSIAGQLHRQVKDLPPGTPISGFTFEQEAP